LAQRGFPLGVRGSRAVDAIGHKADVPSRAREAVSERMDTVKTKVGGTASRAKDAIAGTTRLDDQRLGPVADRVKDKVQEVTTS
jgi:hypothetical protein